MFLRTSNSVYKFRSYGVGQNFIRLDIYKRSVPTGLTGSSSSSETKAHAGRELKIMTSLRWSPKREQ